MVKKRKAKKLAVRLAHAAERAAREATNLRREEERRAAAVRDLLSDAAARAQPGASPETAVGALLEQVRSRRRAMLIINTKSGPHHDSIVHVREIVALLAAHGVDADVRVKLRKKQARREARKAAKSGFDLVIAAGGDGTVEAVAGGLARTKAVLGILPLGTYNNVAGSLGIPEGLPAACALIAAGAAHPIDVGVVRARGKKKARIFLEMAAIGITAALMPAGQEAKKGEWDAAGQALPTALQLAPVPARLTLDGGRPARQATTLLVEIANAPRMGPGITVAPEARMDDGLLDIAIHHDAGQAALMMRLVAMKAGAAPDDEGIERLRARCVEVKTASPLPVVADSKVFGTTPARVEVIPGGLLAIVGDGPGLSHPAAPELLAASAAEAQAIAPEPKNGPDALPIAPPADGAAGIAATVVPAVVPAVGKVASVAGKARGAALPALAGVAGAAALPLIRLLSHRLRR